MNVHIWHLHNFPIFLSFVPLTELDCYFSFKYFIIWLRLLNSVHSIAGSGNESCMDPGRKKWKGNFSIAQYYISFCHCRVIINKSKGDDWWLHLCDCHLGISVCSRFRLCSRYVNVVVFTEICLFVGACNKDKCNKFLATLL